MFSLKRIYQFIITVVFVISFTTKAQTTLNTTQTIPVDETKRDPNSIKLQSGFKYGASASGSRLTLQVNNNPSYVENGYNSFLINACVDPNKKTPLVGEIEGAFSVSQNGSAMYEIAIKVSPGTAGIQPNLKIIYSSGNGSSVLGLGWGLSGLSSITRVSKVPYLDSKYAAVDMTINDVYAIDGNRLMLRTGAYGLSNSTYGTEMESFSTITVVGTLYNSPNYFTVVDKSGTVTEYGNTVTSPNSKLTGVADNTPLAWNVSKITDAFGNYMTYQYKQLSGEVVIDKIFYTLNTAAGITAPYAEVSFDYITKTEKNTNFIGGREFKNTQLLKTITSKYNNELVKKYVFNYEFDYNSMLKDVTEINQDGTELNPTSFCYANPYDNTRGSYAEHNLNIYDGTPSKYNTLKTVFPADFNGDGFTDVLAVQIKNGTLHYDILNNNYDVNLNYTTNTNLDFSTVYNSTNNNNPITTTSVLASFTMDSDFNSKDEVYNFLLDNTDNKKYYIQKISDVGINPSIYQFATIATTPPILTNPIVASNPIKFYYDLNDYTGDGNNDEVIIDPENIILKSSQGNNFKNLIGATLARPFDFDGDGVVDIIIFKDLTTSLSIEILKFKPSSSTFESVASSTIPYDGNTTQDLLKLISIGDFNGDGKTDVLHLSQNKSTMSIIYSDGIQFKPSQLVLSFTPLTTATNYDISSPDFNGDGISDVIFTDAVNAGQPANYQSYFSIGDKLIKGLTTSGKFNDRVYQAVKYNYTYNGVYNSFFKTEKTTAYEYSFDFDGDGISEIMTIDGVQVKTLIDNSISSKVQYLHGVLTGLKKRIMLDYANTNVFKDHTGTVIYSGEPYSVGDIRSVVPKAYVVREVRYLEGGNPSYNFKENYWYGNAVFHKYGKGFLGFLETAKYDSGTNFFTNTKTELDPATHMPQKITQLNGTTSTLGLNLQPFSNYTNKTISIFQITPINNNAIFIAPASIDTKDLLNSTSSITNYSYDLTKAGNLTSKITLHGWSGVTNQSNIKYESTNYTYQTIGGIFKPLSETYQSTQNIPTTNTPYVRTIDYVFDNQKRLTSIIKDQVQAALYQTTNYSNFNAFGSPQKTEIVTANAQNRITESVFDGTGRFVVLNKNVLNQTQEFVYEPKYGSLIQSRDITGLISKYEYDGLGRLVKTKLPNNTINTITYLYEATTGLYNQSVYSQTIRNEGTPFNKTFYNSIGWVMKTETEDVKGNLIIANNVYDGSSRLLKESSEPHYSSVSLQPTYLTTKFTYFDKYLRITKKETFLKTNANTPAYTNQNIFTDYTYSPITQDFSVNYGFHPKIETLTDNTFKRISKTYNGAGQLVNIKNHSAEAPENPGGISTVSTDYQITEYNYSSNGNPNSVTLFSTQNTTPIIHTFNYNAIGAQTQLTDPSAGTINYKYNTLGELIQKDDANGTWYYNYDNIGRLTFKTGSTSGLTTYQYVNAGNGLNQIEKYGYPIITHWFD